MAKTSEFFEELAQSRTYRKLQGAIATNHEPGIRKYHDELSPEVEKYVEEACRRLIRPKALIVKTALAIINSAEELRSPFLNIHCLKASGFSLVANILL